MVSTEISGNEVIVTLNSTLPASLQVNYGSGNDGWDKVTLRSAATGLPAPMIFSRPVDGSLPLVFKIW